MLIDWFTVGAQALNFLILVWLLKRFLYKPILNAIDAREKRIAAELADADAKRAEAEKERDEFQHKNDAFDKERAALLKTATDAAEGERQKLLGEARQAADVLRAKREEALKGEDRNLSQAIIRRTQSEVFTIARRLLSDLATASLEERVSEAFVRRLRALSGTDKEQLATALKSSTRPVPVRSAFDLPPAQQATIRTAINETFSADVHLQFETVPELVAGIELAANGQKVAWSIADYLATLERSVGELLQREGTAAEKPDVKVAAQPAVPAASTQSKAEPKPNGKAEVKTEPRPQTTKPEPKPVAKT